jgi:hypothetical protein
MDSYPTYLGKEVFVAAKAQGIPQLIEVLKSTDKWPGDDFQVVEGDPKEQFDPRYDALFMEWVYLLNAGTNKIEVWMAINKVPAGPKRMAMEHTGIWDDSGYTHIKLGDLDPALNVTDYNWDAMDKGKLKVKGPGKETKA